MSAAVSIELDVPGAPLDFAAVYDELFDFVWRTARRLGVAPEALDDVCQEVFVVVHRRLPEFEGRSSLKTWAFGILHNVVLVHRRTLGRKSPAYRSGAASVDPETLADHRASPLDVLTAAESAELARRLLDEIDEAKRTVLVLVDLEEMAVTEVAEAMGTNLNTTYARLRAARQELAAALKRHRAKDRWRMT